MRDRREIFDCRYPDTGCGNRTDSTFPAVARATQVDLDLAHAGIVCHASGGLTGDLGGKDARRAGLGVADLRGHSCEPSSARHRGLTPSAARVTRRR